MSVHVSSQVWMVKWGSQARKLLALKLADHADDQGRRVYPGVNRVAEEAEMSRRSVQTYLKAWQEIGLLVLIKKGGGGPCATNHFAMNLALLDLIYDAEITVKDCETYIEQGHSVEELIDYLGNRRVENERTDKGAVTAPFKGALSSPLRVQPTTNKGAELLHPTHQEPSKKRRRARTKGCATPANTSIVLTRKDPRWSAWQHYYLQTGQDVKARLMEERGQWSVPSAEPPEGEE